MAYYTKDETRTYIIECTKKVNTTIKDRGVYAAKFLVDPNKALSQLDEEVDIVGLFFLILDEDGGNENLCLKMDGKTFIRIDSDIYCDDRFAIDQYEAAKKGINLSSIIRERRMEESGSSNAPGELLIEKLKSHEEEGKS